MTTVTGGFVSNQTASDAFRMQQIADEEYVRHALIEERKRWQTAHDGNDHGYQAHVSRQTKVTPAHISQVINTNKGVGPRLAFAVAQWLRWSESWHAKALTWWEANGRPGVGKTPSDQPERRYESPHLRADSLCATLVRLGRLAPEKRDEYRPILIGQLGHASDGTLTIEQERSAVDRAFELLARQDEALSTPRIPTPIPEADRLPHDAPSRKPRGKIESKRKRG